MKRVIIDYKKLTEELLNLLVVKFPYGYSDEDIIRFRNGHGEIIEAVEVRTEDTIYLVKVSQGLADTIENFEDEESEGLIAETEFDQEDLENLENDLDEDVF